MNYYFSSDFKLGILGGGQLGKMLLYETRKFDIQTFILDPNEEAPSRMGCNTFYKGSLMDFNTVYEFGKMVDLLTIEIEHVNLDALEKLEEDGLPIFPSPKTLRLIQNKGCQKDFYTENNIPTSAYIRFVDINDLKKALEKNELDFPFVWKAAQGGYDGNGVKIVRSTMDLIHLPEVECLAEALIPFKNELAVIVARSPKGEVKTYPVVEMEFHPEANQVEYTICPARISEELAKKAQEIALRVSKTMDHVGLLAVEMFQTENDEILVNEVAPRPHNSGHYSIEASYTSQFEQHLRAILNLPLGSTASKTAGIMVNLVGEEGYSGQVIYENIEKIMAIDGVTPHIYGKRETRPFRKMGHVTIVNEDMKEARRIAEEVKNSIRVISS
ncbi:5-(carboxyamino)imidazole ribonucleotide synthase [Flavobacterium oreochromis]|uniref:N5-carboxyaminoimidazole ribonucleotide synthase n=1 Tax=Flavobacterium columnare TaxID=996 RepID=A0A246G9R7_9FLAO|nr:5-(carboxyamino)imidazole ribonucleotide synthase [Flavobacterium oreochromis]OWP76452.1 5-(carboxyamino)imidazole ribonucleotide synthase [Flavobacterium oreochromis]QYS86695.1 5-(carboxyamino)imidazole ribonucleotide synthase [Flavobacterium oreochromis]